MAIIGRLKQSTAATVVLGPFVDSTDGVTAETALTISQADVRLSKNAATFAQVNESTSASHMENGYYSKALNTTDTNTLGRLTITVAESGALPIRQEYEIVPAYEFDRLFDTVGPVPELGILDRGTAQSATGTTIVLRSAATFADDTLNGATVCAFGSTQGYWQTRSITDYVLSTDTATVDTWTVTPSGTITYIVFAGAPASATVLPAVNATQIGGQTASASGTVTFPNATLASTTNITAGTITTATNVTTVNGLAANVITAASIATDAIDADAIAANAIDAGAIATGAITNAKFAAGAIDAAAIATDAITAAKIAADAIGASELATDAVNEIVAAVFARAFNAKMSSLTFEELTALMATVLLGKASGMGTATGTFRNLADNADAVVATQDADGNRTAVTRNAINVR
jgi:hypothetical protein